MKQTLFVIQELVSREMKRKYSRSKLGILWSILNPLLSMTVLSLVFSTMFRKSIENYPVYYLTGFLIWNFFTTATNTAMTSLADNQALLLQVRLPREVFPFSRVCTAFVNFLYSLAAYVVILAVFRISLGISAFFLSSGHDPAVFLFFGSRVYPGGALCVFRRYPPSLFRVSHPAYVSFRAFLSPGTAAGRNAGFYPAKSHLSVYFCRQILCYVPGDSLRRFVGENDPLEPFVLSGRNIYFPKSKN